MRIIRYIPSGDVAEVDDQEACDAIAAGEAVPHIDGLPAKAAPVQKEQGKDDEKVKKDEVKQEEAKDPKQETTAAAAAPETAAAAAAPEVK